MEADQVREGLIQGAKLAEQAERYEGKERYNIYIFLFTFSFFFNNIFLRKPEHYQIVNAVVL